MKLALTPSGLQVGSVDDNPHGLMREDSFFQK